MRKCDVCGSTSFHEAYRDEIFHIDGRMVMVQHIPALVCDRCEDATFSRETMEHVRQTVHGDQQPHRQMYMEVFDFV